MVTLGHQQASDLAQVQRFDDARGIAHPLRRAVNCSGSFCSARAYMRGVLWAMGSSQQLVEPAVVLLSEHGSRTGCCRAVIAECEPIIRDCTSDTHLVFCHCEPANGVVVAPACGCYRAITPTRPKHQTQAFQESEILNLSRYAFEANVLEAPTCCLPWEPVCVGSRAACKELALSQKAIFWRNSG
jgi:hypothetical protein